MKRGYLKTYIKVLFFIAIIVSVILGAIYFMKNEYDEEMFETAKTDMLRIEAKTKLVAEKVNMKEKDASYVGKKLEEMKEDEQIKMLIEKEILHTDKKENIYYVLDKENLVTLELTDIELKDGYYIVEYNNNEIIYTKGVQDKEGKLIYTLSEIKNIK